MISRFPRAALLAAMLSTAALAAPPVASAVVEQPEVNGNALTVKSDGGSDTITLTAVGGVLVVGGFPATGLAADDNAEIVVEAGGGNDVVDASALADANYGGLRIEGGEGGDFLTGGAGADALHGDAGNDRLVGFRGVDAAFGGEGDDLMVWNNGDGTDDNLGEAGFDESEINGSPTVGDNITFTPLAGSPEEVEVERLNPNIGFAVHLSAERLTINGLGGADNLHPANAQQTIVGRTSLVLNGGSEGDGLFGDGGPDLISGGGGEDHIEAGSGPDTISGGDAADFVLGDAGDDRLLGDRGSDLMSGVAGDDVLVWNNGDGSDEIEGEAGFDRFEFNGAAAAGDALSLADEVDVTTMRRTNLVPITIGFLAIAAPEVEAHGGIEQVSVDGLGGDDTFSVADGLAGLLVAAQGGAGNDVLEGSEEEDTFLGGTGADSIDPGAGSDLIDGQEGDDELFATDGFADLVRGGAGTDSALADSAKVDAVDGVENLTSPPIDFPPNKPQPAADTRALLPQVGKISVMRKGSSLFARVPLTCPAAEAGGCAATVTLQTAAAIKLGKVKAPLVLGSKGARLATGQQGTATVRLVTGVEELARSGRLKVRLRLDSADATGNSATTSSALSLRVPARLRERP